MNLESKKSLFRTKYELYERHVDDRGIFSSKSHSGFSNLDSLRRALLRPYVDEEALNNKYSPSDVGRALATFWAGAARSLKALTGK